MLTQYGVLPVRSAPGGRLEVLLITSRDTRRWVVPRGNPLPGKSDVESAAQEAFEEAGISGPVGTEAIGSYSYAKRRRLRRDLPAQVHLFRMEVQTEAEDWPEKSQRERRWFPIREAAAAVAEPDLADLIVSLDPAAAEDAIARARRAVEAFSEPALVLREDRVEISNAGARATFGSGIEGRDVPPTVREALEPGDTQQRPALSVARLENGALLVCLTGEAGAAEAVAAALSRDPPPR